MRDKFYNKHGYICELRDVEKLEAVKMLFGRYHNINPQRPNSSAKSAMKELINPNKCNEFND